MYTCIAVDTVGLFRIPGNAASIGKLKQQFNHVGMRLPAVIIYFCSEEIS